MSIWENFQDLNQDDIVQANHWIQKLQQKNNWWNIVKAGVRQVKYWIWKY